jgi:glycosyltransferase involved in cell wall biosynthesis
MVTTGMRSLAPPAPSGRRVAVFAGHYSPHIGGVETYSQRLWTRMIRRGWEVLLVTSDVGGGPPEERADGITVHRLPCLGLMGGRFPIVLPSLRLARTLRALNALNPGAVVTNLRFMPPCWLGAAWAWLHGVPRLHIEHGSSHVPLRSLAGNWASALIDRTVGRLMVRSAHRCVGVSSGSRAFVESLGAVNPGLLPAGVDVSLPEAAPRDSWRDRLGLAKGERAVLFLGRVTEDKGILVLLDAWTRLDAQHGVHLVIAGDGGAMPEVRRRAAAMKGVQVLGPVPPVDVPNLLSACDLLVHPSLASEGRPMAILEAAAAGLAVLSTPQGVAGDLVASPQDGTLVPAGSPDALAEALRRVLEDDQGRLAQGASLQRRVLEMLGWDRVLATAEAELQATSDAGQ